MRSTVRAIDALRTSWDSITTPSADQWTSTIPVPLIDFLTVGGRPWMRSEPVPSAPVAAGTMPLDVRNLVTLSRFPIASHRQIKHDITPRPAYRRVTAIPPDVNAIEITWERPILLAAVTLPDGFEPYETDVRLQSTKMRGPVQQAFQWKVGGTSSPPQVSNRTGGVP